MEQSEARSCMFPAEIKMTEDMISAGVAELRERCFGESLDQIVEGIFRAMYESLSSKLPNQ